MGTALLRTSSSSTQDRHRILVCLDRPAAAELCLPFAVSLAKTFESGLTLLHVMQPHQDQPARSASDPLAWELSRQEAEASLQRLQGSLAEELGSPVDARLEQGRPAERIADLAAEIGAGLTVLGSHGAGRGPSSSLGSTAQQVLSKLQGSVFIARASSGAGPSPIPRRILVPLDGSRRSESVLPTAARLAETHGATLLLVHVVQDPLPTALLHTAEDLLLAQNLAGRLERSALRYLQTLKEQLGQEGNLVETFVLRHVNERQCVLELSAREGADLIILSAHGSACSSAGFFGSVTDYLLQHSLVPLMVLQDLPEAGARRSKEHDSEPPPLRASYAAERM